MESSNIIIGDVPNDQSPDQLEDFIPFRLNSKLDAHATFEVSGWTTHIETQAETRWDNVHLRVEVSPSTRNYYTVFGLGTSVFEGLSIPFMLQGDYYPQYGVGKLTKVHIPTESFPEMPQYSPTYRFVMSRSKREANFEQQEQVHVTADECVYDDKNAYLQGELLPVNMPTSDEPLGDALSFEDDTVLRIDLFSPDAQGVLLGAPVYHRP